MNIQEHAALFFVLFLPLTLYGNKTMAKAKDLGIIIGSYQQGKHNAITDVKGVRVGQTTLSSGSGKLVPTKGPVRTGVTVIIPAEGNLWQQKLAAGSFVLNGNGEAMGLMWVQEGGIIETPIALTNTLNVAHVQRGLIEYMIKQNPKIGIDDDTLTPIVFECDDSYLNDIQGQHVKPEHVLQAIKHASSSTVDEGAVGAGTGMMTYEFKGGIGTSSRVLPKKVGSYTIGVLVNANHGDRKTLRIKGAPVGLEITDLKPKLQQDGSIIVIVATDAPLDSRQLSRLSKRVMLGLARTGGIAYHGSGDVALAFSTANRIPHYPKKAVLTMKILSDFWLDDLFEAATDAAEEAIINAMLAAKTTDGRDGNIIYALPHDRLLKILKKYQAVAVH